jgi:hypothetical protein
MQLDLEPPDSEDCAGGWDSVAAVALKGLDPAGFTMVGGRSLQELAAEVVRAYMGVCRWRCCSPAWATAGVVVNTLSL